MSKGLERVIKMTDTFKELFWLYACMLGSAAFLFSFFEHKKLWDSFWWATVTAMTVGYGDIYPVTIGGRIVGMFLMHGAPLFIIPILTARLSSKLIVNNDVFNHQEQEEIKDGIRQIKAKLNI